MYTHVHADTHAHTHTLRLTYIQMYTITSIPYCCSLINFVNKYSVAYLEIILLYLVRFKYTTYVASIVSRLYLHLLLVFRPVVAFENGNPHEKPVQNVD